MSNVFMFEAEDAIEDDEKDDEIGEPELLIKH